MDDDLDVVRAIGAVTRAVEPRAETCAVIASRSFDAPIADVWDAITNPARIPRWLLPVSGELRVGGRYQLEGNAGGTITACDPPRLLAVTWEYGDEVSELTVSLADDQAGTTTLRLEHVVPTGGPHWDEFGPGAVGVGWDLSILGLAEHIATGGDVDGAAYLASAGSKEFMQRSSDDWCRAAVASGTPAADAQARAARTSAAYSGS